MSNIVKAKKSVSYTTRTSLNEVKKQQVPKGAEIVSSDIRTETEEIENGWLITKSYDVRYRVKGNEGTEYAYFTKKWYSKEDPLTIDLKDKSLAEAFEE